MNKLETGNALLLRESPPVHTGTFRSAPNADSSPTMSPSASNFLVCLTIHYSDSRRVWPHSFTRARCASPPPSSASLRDFPTVGGDFASYTSQMCFPAPLSGDGADIMNLDDNLKEIPNLCKISDPARELGSPPPPENLAESRIPSPVIEPLPLKSSFLSETGISAVFFNASQNLKGGLSHCGVSADSRRTARTFTHSCQPNSMP